MLALSFSAFDPTVRYCRALKAGCEQMEGVVLLFVSLPCVERLWRLAIMDIRAT